MFCSFVQILITKTASTKQDISCFFFHSSHQTTEVINMHHQIQTHVQDYFSLVSYFYFSFDYNALQ